MTQNEIALKMGLEEDDYEQHGKYRAKVELSVLKKNKDNNKSPDIDEVVAAKRPPLTMGLLE